MACTMQHIQYRIASHHIMMILLTSNNNDVDSNNNNDNNDTNNSSDGDDNSVLRRPLARGCGRPRSSSSSVRDLTAAQSRSFMGWSNRRFDNLHFIISDVHLKRTNKQLHVSNRQ